MRDFLRDDAVPGLRGTREWSLAALGALLLAVAMTWPTLRHPLSTLPRDLVDPSLQAWQVAWGGHALRHDLFGIWQTNASFGQHYPLAFSDSLLGYAPFGLLGSGPTAAVLRYNILFVLASALASLGAYALVRQLGGSVLGSAVAGVAFGYAPWRFSQAGHLNILSDGGIVLALAMLARGHGWSLTGGYRPDLVRPRWAVAGWLVAAWQVSLGFGLGLPFSYLLLLIIAVSAIGWLWRRPRLPARLLGADLVGGLLFSAVLLVLIHPYLQVLRQHPDSRRTEGLLKLYSPPVRGFFTADQTSWLWGMRQVAMRQALSWPPEMTLLPGFALLALAAIGLLSSIWSVRARLLLSAGVLATAWLALGTNSPGQGRYGYLVVFHLLPGLDGSRTPGRLVLWTILLLCVLAAGAVSSLRSLGSLGSALSVLALVAVLLEGVSHPKHPQVPAAPVRLPVAAQPLMVLPSSQLFDPLVLLWSTDGFARLVNGSSGYNPPEQEKLRQTMQSFPDSGSIAALRALGVKTVVVLRGQPVGSPYQAALTADVAGLPVLRTDIKTAVIFTF